MAILNRLYRKLIPREKRQVLYDKYLGNIWQKSIRHRLKMKIKAYHFLAPIFPKSEKKEAFLFMAKHGLTLYPSNYSLKYRDILIEPVLDNNIELSYVLHNGKKLYFPQYYSKDRIIQVYRELITEQDVDSAHKYVNNVSELKGKVLLDVGAAEGVFSLNTIEYTKHVYLFECDERWVKALEATFAPWIDKVTIIRKYVDIVDSATCVCLDSFMKDKAKDNIFLKMDIEGMELQALQGGRKLFDENKVSFSICVYHHPEDVKTIPSFLDKYKHTYEFSKGYLCMGPGLRRGLVRSV